MQSPRFLMRLTALVALAFLFAAPSRADRLQVTVAPVGPTASALQALRASLPNDPALRRYLSGTSWRLLSLQLVDSDAPGNANPSGRANGVERLDRFLAVFYDYTNDRALLADGKLVPGTGDPVRVTVLSQQPNTNEEELAAAVLILRQDPVLGPAIESGALRPYPPMPPVVESPDPGVHVERIVNVGLLAVGEGQEDQIVGVNMIHGTVVRSAGRAPQASLAAATSTTCGAVNAGQATTPRGTAGQYDVTIARGTTEIWRFTVLRPSVSTGTNASAIELRNVTYKGKLVLGRAHTPVLNVKYSGDACGPYRDWQWQENPFVSDGTDVAPGIRNAATPPSTIIDSGNDTGNFAGVSYFVGASDVTFTSELQAGWYRYIPTWRFLDNGTIQPRISFAAVENGCVCNVHTHNAYWRFDFDIGTAAGNTISQRKGNGWKPVKTETSGKRNQTGIQWLVQNSSTGNGYRVVPGPYDGVADTFGVADYWLLRGKGSQELDDGISCVTCTNAYIQIDSFVNGESIQNQDVVFWYGAHFVHDVTATTTTPESVGPDLVVDSW